MIPFRYYIYCFHLSSCLVGKDNLVGLGGGIHRGVGIKAGLCCASGKEVGCNVRIHVGVLVGWGGVGRRGESVKIAHVLILISICWVGGLFMRKTAMVSRKISLLWSNVIDKTIEIFIDIQCQMV